LGKNTSSRLHFTNSNEYSLRRCKIGNGVSISNSVISVSTDYEPTKGLDDNYVTDAEAVVIGNTSGTNTGDEDTSSIQNKDH